MRVSAPIGRSGARVQGGCILTPVMLLIYVVFYGAAAAILTAALVAVALYYLGYGLFLAGRALYRRWSGRGQNEEEPPPENQAQYSDRR